MNDVGSTPPARRPVQCLSLDDSEIVSGFRRLEALLRGCLGGGGGGVAVTSEAGLVSLVSCSERVLASLPTPAPPLSLVTTAVGHQVACWKDGGTVTGATLAGLLWRLLGLSLPRRTVRLGVQTVMKTCLQAVGQATLRLSLEVPQLMGVIMSVLRSKSALVPLTATERRHLSLQVLRAFLQVIPLEVEEGDRARMGQVHVQLVSTGDVTESRPLTSLLLRQPALDDLPMTSPLTSYVATRRRCLLFTPHLGGQEDALKEADVSLTDELARRCLSAERCVSALSRLDLSSVSIIACQRTVHQDVRSFLSTRGVLSLDRLGSSGAALFSSLTGAQPLGGLSLLTEVQTELRVVSDECSEHADSLMGKIDGVRRMVIAGATYVELCREKAPVVTLLVHYPYPEEQRDELKRQLDACLLCLTSLLREPTVVPGGGCLETVTHSSVLRQVRGADRGVREVSHAICSVLRQNALSISGRPALYVDAIYHHAWEAELRNDTEDGACVCGLVRASDLRGSRDLSEFTASFFSDGEPVANEVGERITTDPAGVDRSEICEETLVDAAGAKTSSLTIAFEACYAILGIESCLIEKR